MLRNNITVALRNLSRERFFAVLNILGLAAALSCSTFIGIWCWDEWRRDRFFPNADRIVRVASTVISDTETFRQAVTSVPTGPALLNDYPEVEAFVRFDGHGSIVKIGDKQYLEEDLLTVDSNFFSVFNYDLALGDIKTALVEPYTVVLTEKLARKYFGDQNPIGQTLTMLQYDATGQGMTYRVTGVLAGEARPAHFTFDMLVSFSTFLKYAPGLASPDGWGNNSYHTYLLLKNADQCQALEAKLPQFYEKYLKPLYGQHNTNIRNEFFLQPAKDIYLHSHLRYEFAPTGDAANLRIFGMVGLLILFVAGINYINMATARAGKRARSTGVRKALGAQRGQLARQFLSESVLTALFAAALSLAFCSMLQPVFEKMTGKPLGISDFPMLPILVAGVGMLLGVLAGAYPAFVLSGFRPEAVLKGSADASFSKTGSLRQVLVTVQFVVSIALIVSVLVINEQMDFIKNKNLGYEKQALLTLRVNGDQSIKNGIEAFRNDVTAGSNLVKGMTFANGLPIGGTGNSGASTENNQGKQIRSNIFRFRVDYDYAPVLGLQFVAGRNFSRDFPADKPTDTTQNYLLNEAAVRAFGWQTPELAIGKPFQMDGRRGQVAGIVRDFHFNSLKHKVEPLAMYLTTANLSVIVLRIDMSHAQMAIAEVESKWKKHFPQALFDYAFLDEKLDLQYRAELRFGSLFSAFSLFSIFIACLGLFGLAAYAAERRTKEIGIRKVLGASVACLTGLLVRDFLKLVLLAIVIASPVAYYFMEKWLSNYAFHIEMKAWMFAVTGISALLIALITVGGQAVKAAWANPAKSLSNE